MRFSTDKDENVCKTYRNTKCRHFSSKPDSRIQYIPSMIFFRHPVRLLAGKSLVSLMRTYIKKRGAGLSPVPRYKGSRIAQFVETSNVESPTPRVYIKPLATSTDRCSNGYINVPWGVPVALFLTNCL